MTQTITALFETVAQAERAAYDLAARVGGVRGEVYGASRTSELSLLEIPNEDRAVLHEDIRRGGAVLHAEVPEDRFQAVADALEAAGALDIEEREATWRREGWTGASTTPTSGPATAAGAAGTETAMPLVAGDDTSAVATPAGTDTGMTTRESAADMTSRAATSTVRDIGATGGEERIPIVEERVNISKRQTGHGRVRVRSYVVETPVQEQVTLHEERVQVERRPVDRPVGAADDAFRDKTIEATETSEEAVVSKEARVKEEVVIRKEAEERTETVRDTVRRTEVEVEDERGRTGAPEQRRDRT